MRSPLWFNIHASQVSNFAIEIQSSRKKVSLSLWLEMCSKLWKKKKPHSIETYKASPENACLTHTANFSSRIQSVLFSCRDGSLGLDTSKCWGLTPGPQFQRENMQKETVVYWCHLLGLSGFAWLGVSLCLSPEQKAWAEPRPSSLL